MANATKKKVLPIRSLPRLCDSYGSQSGEGVSCADNISKTKMELYGSELIQKEVRPSGDCGRVYVPLAWVGKKVKIILVD